MSETGSKISQDKVELDMDLTEKHKIESLKRKKAIVKSAFTKARNILEKLLDSDLPSRGVVRVAIDKVCDCQFRAIGTISKLSEAYEASKQIPLVEKLSVEISALEETGTEIQDRAQLYLRNMSDVKSSDNESCQMSLLFHSESRYHENSQKVNNSQTRKQIVGSAHGECLPKHTPPEPVKHDTRGDAKRNASYELGTDMWKQLKRVSIPVFTGDVKSYEGWKASFMACVDNAPSTPEYKLLQLRQYVSGEALKVIQDLGHNAAAYDIALERLDRKYGGKRRQLSLQLDEVNNFKQIRIGNAKDLERFADMLDIVVVNLRDSDKVEELGDGCLYNQLIKKMNDVIVTQYLRWIFETQRRESVETLREWVLQESEFQTVASEAINGLTAKAKTYVSKGSPKVGSYFGDKPLVTNGECKLCKGQHHELYKCTKFKAMNVSARWEHAKRLRLCFRCLGTKHLSRNCRRQTICGIDSCQQKHSRFLHTKKANPSVERSQTETACDTDARMPILSGENQGNATTMSSRKSKRSSVVSLRTVPVVLKHGTKRIVVNALLDDGSNQTYLNEDVAAELGLEGQPQTISVNVLNGQSEKLESTLVEFGLESLDGSVDLTLSALTTTKVTGQMQVVDWNKVSGNWKHLENVQFPEVSTPHVVDILIGIDYVELHQSYREVRGGTGEPMARLTPLGWTCVGLVSDQQGRNMTSGTYFTQSEDSELNSILHKFWEVEQFPTSKQNLNKMDESIVETVKETMRHENDRYEVGIPWKQSSEKLPDSFEMAYRRLCSTEKKLSKDKAMAETYDSIVLDYLRKGYIQRICDRDSRDAWYLPHFPVVKPGRSTTKVRIVFDASAKCQGTSLNDAIHEGPKLQNDLFQILLRFRNKPVALVCDIAEMYMQIGVHEKDCSFLRFLWRSMNVNDDVQIYEFKRVVFGLNVSPFLAQFVSQENARKFQHLLPKAAETVLRSTYMDDSLDSVNTESEAIELYEQLTALWGKASMRPRKWLSNSAEVLSHIPVEDRAEEVDLNKDQLPATKTLGLVWVANEDEFSFRNSTPQNREILTKRSFLSEIARIFDPLGFLAPFHVRAKIIMQQMWLKGVGWDDDLDPCLKQMALQWLGEVQELHGIRFSRCLQLNLEITKSTMHVFVDASEEAYGAVAYDVKHYVNGSTSSQLVAAKSKVAPLKATSIPRLELMAAVLGVKLLLAITRAVEIDTSGAVMWSDSQNVLCWIKNQSRNFKTFVANRVGYIQESTEPSQWKHVPSELNAADVITRGTHVPSLKESMWTNGPEFIQLSENHWPKQSIKTKTLDENHETKANVLDKQMPATFVSTADTWLIEPTRHSDWLHLVRLRAWVCRFVNNCRSTPDSRQTGVLQPEEIVDAEYQIIGQAQHEVFGKEILALKSKKPIASSSKIVGLDPVLDDDGLVRSGGRLKFADCLPFDARFPVILPRRHWVTKLIVKKYHEDGKHCLGTNQMLASISSRFWIVAGREEIREWGKTCAKCIKNKAKPAVQKMAPLPKSRVKCSYRAFSQTGVDFAGPFLTIHGRGKPRHKRYLCLFTCLATRAVHLEMAYSLDTDSFLNAFYRMANRRGMPTEMISDNGTNFVGAVKELKNLVAQLDENAVKTSLANHGVVWKFNPPQAPHFGGVFECMIKAAKKAIFAILSSGDINDEELMTAFSGAEALINSRPLTYHSSDHRDDVPLTPNHFLHGQIGGVFAPDSVDYTPFNPRKRWRRVQELVRHFWRRWMKEWLPSLQTRKKWFNPRRDLQVDDVVLIISPNQPRGTWDIGRIQEAHPGSDGLVRVVTIQTSRGVLTRPVTKVCPLEWTDLHHGPDVVDAN